jgi:hypothetical protein
MNESLLLDRVAVSPARLVSSLTQLAVLPEHLEEPTDACRKGLAIGDTRILCAPEEGALWKLGGAYRRSRQT